MLGLLGDEWNLLIIQQALLGASRYGHFTARLPVSNSVLTTRLRMLVDEGLLSRRANEYLPTARSRSLWPILVSIWEWERTWVAESPSPVGCFNSVAVENRSDAPREDCDPFRHGRKALVHFVVNLHGDSFACV